MGQPLETFCNKNLSIPFFSESQQETGSSSKNVSFILLVFSFKFLQQNHVNARWHFADRLA